MKNLEPDMVLSDIRLLVDGKQPTHDISQLLFARNCFYLLSKIKSPNPFLEKQRVKSVLNKICVRERFQACRKLFDALQNEGIPYAVIKGAVLSRTAYGDEFIRQSGDVDILIRRKDLDKIKSIFLHLGFIQGQVTADGLKPYSRKELIFQNAMSHQTPSFIKKTGHSLLPYLNVDVNFDIFWGESEQKADMDFVLAQTVSDALFNVSFQRLTCVMEFISLCMHHYKDMNSLYLLSERGLRLDQFCDILYYLKNSDLDIPDLLKTGRQLGVIDYLYYCVYYANEVFAHPVLSHYLNALDAAKSTDLTPYYGLNNAERKKWEIPLANRLFDPEFPEKFFHGLSTKEQEKVKYNRTYM